MGTGDVGPKRVDDSLVLDDGAKVKNRRRKRIGRNTAGEAGRGHSGRKSGITHLKLPATAITPHDTSRSGRIVRVIRHDDPGLRNPRIAHQIPRVTRGLRNVVGGRNDKKSLNSILPVPEPDLTDQKTEAEVVARPQLKVGVDRVVTKSIQARRQNTDVGKRPRRSDVRKQAGATRAQQIHQVRIRHRGITVVERDRNDFGSCLVSARGRSGAGVETGNQTWILGPQVLITRAMQRGHHRRSGACVGRLLDLLVERDHLRNDDEEDGDTNDRFGHVHGKGPARE